MAYSEQDYPPLCPLRLLGLNVRPEWVAMETLCFAEVVARCIAAFLAFFEPRYNRKGKTREQVFVLGCAVTIISGLI